MAGTVAAAAMYLVAALAGVSTLPDLLSEPLLAAMPGPIFGFLIDNLQHLGKVVEEAGLLVAMVAALGLLGAARGAAAGRLPAPLASPLAAGATGWLVVAAGVLPLAGRGLLGLADGPVPALCWALVFAVYAAVLGSAQPVPPAEPAPDAGRRRLLVSAPGALTLLALGFLGLRLVPGWYRYIAQAAAASPGGPVPDLTPAESFYVVSKNFNDPQVALGGWALRVRGRVAAAYQLTYDQLGREPSVTLTATLECISNLVGGDLISTGRFTGVSLGRLVQRAQPAAEARAVTLHARDGYTESLPLEIVMSEPDIIVAYLLDGARLPAAHGFPARLLVPGRYGMKGPKWLDEIELTADLVRGYWEGQGWDQDAIVKPTSRIDTPRDRDILPAGPTVVAGIAYAGRRGISMVEVSADGGRRWSEAALRTPLSPLAWTLWSFSWPAERGEHDLVVRARDGTGRLQDPAAMPSFPAGASGLHHVRVSVR